MTFKTQMAADISAVFFDTAEFADTGTFTRFSTSATTANVPFIINIAASDSQENYGVADIATIAIPASALTSKPLRHDKITKGTATYTFRERLSADDDVYLYSVDTEERHNEK